MSSDFANRSVAQIDLDAFANNIINKFKKISNQTKYHGFKNQGNTLRFLRFGEGFRVFWGILGDFWGNFPLFYVILC